MSELDDAMSKHMAYLVYSENRTFCYRDFLYFEVDGKPYGMKHGVFRNKISKLIKTGRVEVSYRSVLAFYSLKGVKFGKPVTPNHTVVHNDPIYYMLQDLPLERQSIHDIRLRFKVPDIWQTFSINPNFNRNKRSEDIAIPTWHKDNALIRTIIHKTGVVSVIIGCSLNPLPLNADGIIRFFTLLARVEERLQTFLDNSTPINSGKTNNAIPEFKSWIVTMWHFGRDASIEYFGERLSITVETAQHILTRLYVKDFNGKNRIRIERQEYPRKTIIDAIEEKLHDNSEVE